MKDTTCTAQFRVVRDERSERFFEGVEGELYFLAWTTTPWTLPSNTALAVGPAIDYVRVKCRNPYTDEAQTVILARELVPSYFTKKMEGTFEVEDRVYKGPEFEGVRYEQLLPWVRPMGDAFRVIVGDYVTTTDGTGIVHIAPTFGAECLSSASMARSVWRRPASVWQVVHPSPIRPSATCWRRTLTNKKN